MTSRREELLGEALAKDRTGSSVPDDLLSHGMLDDDLGFHCRLAQLHFFSSFFEDLGGFGVTPAYLSALMTIAENPGVRQGVLAEALMIKRSAMTKLMRGLEDGGLISRVSPRSDLRSVELTLTPAGQDLVARARPLMEGQNERATPMLSPGERQLLMALLKKIAGRN